MYKVKDSPKLVRDTFQITEEQQKKLKEIAKKTGRSKAEIVRKALEEYLSKES